jgi:hypothetical protein
MEAGGVGIFIGVENTQLIDFSGRQKRTIPRNCAQLERIWNARLSARVPHSFSVILLSDLAHCLPTSQTGSPELT